jgi:hypothetical protein
MSRVRKSLTTGTPSRSAITSDLARPARDVVDRLAVRSDEVDSLWIDAGLPQELAGRRRELLAEDEVEPAEIGDRTGPQTDHRLAQPVGIRHRLVRDHRDDGLESVATRADERRVDAIRRRTGDEPQDQLLVLLDQFQQLH